jgi:hypothetical protein
MGALVVAMPRTTYATSSTSIVTPDVAASKIIGSNNMDVDLLSFNIARRLSSQSGRRVFVSCTLSAHSSSACQSDEQVTDPAVKVATAAALAEREVRRLLLLQPN